jgi:hypothetical protein
MKRSGLCWAGPIGWAKQEKQAGEGQQGGEARAVEPAGPEGEKEGSQAEMKFCFSFSENIK